MEERTNTNSALSSLDGCECEIDTRACVISASAGLCIFRPALTSFPPPLILNYDCSLGQFDESEGSGGKISLMENELLLRFQNRAQSDVHGRYQLDANAPDWPKPLSSLVQTYTEPTDPQEKETNSSGKKRLH